MKCGGKDEALKNAIEWRNATEQRICKPRSDLNMVTSTRSETGVVGVRLNPDLNRYEICWVDKDGQTKRTSRSIKRHGSKKAFKMACDIRKQKESERLGTEI